MNRKLSEKFSDKFSSIWNSIAQKTRSFMDEYDIASMPAFFMFLVVTTAGMTINFFFLSPTIGKFEAFAISLMFEVGIISWKFQSHRVKNSAAQAEIVNWAMWLSVVWAFSMLIASLTGRFFWGWIVAGAALTHVIAYLLFDQNDDVRNNRRTQKQAAERLNQKNFVVTNAINEAEADLRIIGKITTEISRLRQQNSSLPKNELEFVLDATRKRLLLEYKASENVRQATKDIADVDGDGLIAGERPS